MDNTLDNPSLDRPTSSGITTDYKRIKSARITSVATADDELNFTEPSSPECADHLRNNITVTPSGHVIEIDDSDGAERICIFHKSGHFIEMTTEHKVTKVYGKDYTFILDDSNEFVSGSKNVTVSGNVNLLVMGDCTQKIQGNFTQKVNGHYNVYVDGEYNVLSKGKMQLQTLDNMVQKSGKQTNVYSTETYWLKASQVRIQDPNYKQPVHLKLNFGLQLPTSLSQPSVTDQYINRTLNASMISTRETGLTYPKDRTVS
jgi:hypothetical protein